MRSALGVGRFGAMLGLMISACGGQGGSACTEVREPEDPLSANHVIAGEDAESYFADVALPPTSGPHVAAPAPKGVLRSPIENPLLQVRILESGAALLQHESVGPDRVDDLEALAGPTVVVAPGTNLPAPIVATAWTWKLTCTQLDIEAIADFVATRPADAPGTD